MGTRLVWTLAAAAGTAMCVAGPCLGDDDAPAGAVPVGIPVVFGPGGTGPCNGPQSAEPGPDLVICRIGGADGADLKDYTPVGGVNAYAFGTTSCNNGTTLLYWMDDPPEANHHPVIAQNVYRLRQGRFEQIGMSWLKHGFCAADTGICAPCSPAGNCLALGIGCADTYQATINGDYPQFLGPRSEVNPATGFFPFPHSTPSGPNAGRILINADDLNAFLNFGARYFGEAQYITPDDAGTPNAHNNVSWREIEVGAPFYGTYPLDFIGETVQQEPAIRAWQDIDPRVDLINVDVPDDGRFILGANATERPDGTWDYEYALYNMNSHRAAQQLAVAVAPGASLTHVGFHDVSYHSGESYSGQDWSFAAGAGEASWSTEPIQENPNANALRWGTLYNFRFRSDAPPALGAVTIGLFRAGSPGQVTVAAQVPMGAPAQALCPSDCNGDGEVGIEDFLMVLGAACDTDGDGTTGIADFLNVLGNWGPCS